MKLSKFKFKLPTELIALHPAENRDECRLMVLNKKQGRLNTRCLKIYLIILMRKMCLCLMTQRFSGPFVWK